MYTLLCVCIISMPENVTNKPYNYIISDHKAFLGDGQMFAVHSSICHIKCIRHCVRWANNAAWGTLQTTFTEASLSPSKFAVYSKLLPAQVHKSNMSINLYACLLL